jgi:hypothetical protein
MRVCLHEDDNGWQARWDKMPSALVILTPIHPRARLCLLMLRSFSSFLPAAVVVPVVWVASRADRERTKRREQLVARLHAAQVGRVQGAERDSGDGSAGVWPGERCNARTARCKARTAWWCELAWPGQAAHPAGSYKYSYLSQRFEPVRAKPTSTASPTSTSRDGFGTNFCYRNQMRDSAQEHVLQLEAFLSRLATYKTTRTPAHPNAPTGRRP